MLFAAFENVFHVPAGLTSHPVTGILSFPSVINTVKVLNFSSTFRLEMGSSQARLCILLTSFCVHTSH